MHFEEYKKSKDVISILVIEDLYKIESINKQAKNKIIAIQELVSNVISRGIKNGVFRKVDPEKTSVIFLSLIWTILKHGILMEEEELEDKYFGAIFDLLFYGIVR